MDERLDVGMVAAKNPHLRAATGTRGLDRRATLIEHSHVGQRSAGAAVRAPDMRALGTDVREVVAYAATAPHRLGGLFERHIDTDAMLVAGDAVAYRLDEAIQQRCLEVGACGGIDPSAEDETVLLGDEECLLPPCPQGGLLDGSQRARNAALHRLDRLLVTLGVLLEQDLHGN